MIRLGAPAVEMLWEDVDPEDALVRRFGFADRESAGRWVAAMLADHWGVQVDACSRIVISGFNALAWVGTPSGPLLAKWSVVPALYARLSHIACLVGWLGARGLPITAPLPALDERLQVEADGVSMCLQRRVDGDQLDVDEPCPLLAERKCVDKPVRH